MKKSVYLDKKISNINNNISLLKKKRLINILVKSLLVLGLTTVAIALADVLSFYSAASMLGVWDALAILYGYIGVKDRNRDISQFENEKEHLKKIKLKGIKSTKKLDAKRLERIYELKEKQEAYVSKDNIGNFILAAGVFTSVISSILLILTNVAGVGAVIGLLSSALSARSLMKNGDEITKLDARIANLKNDIELGSIYGYNPKNTGANEGKQTLNKGDLARTVTYSPIQEQQVDQYIAELEKSSSDSEKGKTLVKKMEENL